MKNHVIPVAVNEGGRLINFEMRDIPDFEYFVREKVNLGRGYEHDITALLARAIRPGDRVIDAGANVGFFTIMMSQLVGDDDAAAVLAFEPDVFNFRRLIDNLELNAIDNVLAVPMALWDSDGQVVFNETGTHSSSTLEVRASHVNRVIRTARTLDSIVPPEWGHVRLIKVDCEGAEHKILCGARNLLKRGVDFVVFEINFDLMPAAGFTQWDIRLPMHHLGYECFVLKPNGEKPIPLPIDYDLEVETLTKTVAPKVNCVFTTPDKIKAIWQ